MSEAATSPPVRSGRSGTALGVVLAALAAVAVYAPTYAGGGHGFVNYDDPYLLSPDNPSIARGFAGFLELLDPLRPHQFMNAWLPFYYGSLGLDHAVFGDAAWGYHLHSALLHALGAALVVLLARRVGLGKLGAAVAGLAFALHPALTENVAWVAGRKDVLSFAWMALAALAYLEGRERSKAAWHVAGCACLAISLMSKGTTLVLPLLLAAHALLVLPRTRSKAERLLPVVPYAAVAAAFTALHLWVAHNEGTTAAGGSASLGAVVVADLGVVLRYAGLLFAPFPPLFRQSVEHAVDPHATSAAAAVVGAAALVAWVGAVVVLRRSRPLVAAALLCAGLALLPFNNVLPRTSVLFAERYAHVAILPVALLVGGLSERDGFLRGVGLALPLALGFVTLHRLPVWRDGVTLWEDAVEKAPQSALVQMQYANALETAARATPAEADALNARAESAWRTAMSRAADAGDELARMRAETGLGTHLLTTAPGGTNTEERVRECVALLDSAERRLSSIDVPGARTAQLATIRANRAAAHEALGDTDLALADWQAATQADETSAAAWNGLARAHFAAGHGDDASKALAKSAAVAPDDPAAARERARLLLAGGEPAGAKAEMERVLAKHPGDFDTLMDLARLDALLQRPLDAEKGFRRALAIRPGDAGARQGIAAALLDQAQARCSRDDLEEARQAAAAAMEFAPDSSGPEQVLGIVARRNGDLEQATVHFRRARDLFPAGVRIREALASVLLERAFLAFEAGDAATGNALAEEAAGTDAPSVATRAARLEWGVGGWPAASPTADARAVVSRQAALRALTCVANGRPADALPELVVAERGSEGGDPRFRRNVVRLLVRARFLAGKVDEAVAAAEELPALGTPEEPWSGWADLASALTERGIARRGGKDRAGATADFDRARQLLDAAQAHGMPEARRHLRLGEILFAEERFVEATRELDRAAEGAPDDPEPLLDRAAIWRTHFLLEEDKSYLRGAEKDLRAALAVSPSDPRAMAALGEVLVYAARPSEAYPWLQRALLADPSQSGTRKLLVDLAVRAGRSNLEKRELKEAHEVADRAVRLDAPTPDAGILLGDVLRAEGAWDRALAEYERAAAEHPDSVDARAALARHWFDVGHAMLLRNRARDAAQAFVKCLAFDQDKTDVSSARERLHAIAVSSFEEGVKLRAALKLPEAAEAFATSVLAEGTREGRFDLGLCLTEMGDLEGAATAFADAVAAAPDDLPARSNHAAVLLRLGRWDEAEVEYRWLLGHAPEGDADRAVAERQLRWIEEQRREMDRAPPPGPKR